MPFDYEGRDLLLGLRRSNSDLEMVVNLGQVSRLRNLAPGAVVRFTEFSPEQMRAAFPDMTNVRWSVAAATLPEDGGDMSVPDWTLFMTRRRVDLETESRPWERRSYFSQGGAANAVTTVGSIAERWSAFVPLDPILNTETVVIKSSTSPNSFSRTIGNSGNFGGTFSGSIENLVENAGQPERSDFYELFPLPLGTSTDPFGHSLGFFELRPDQTLIFRAAGTAASVPENVPTGVLLASVLLALAGHRKS